MEARQACAKPTARMIVKGTAGISRKKNKNREHDVIEEEDPAGGAYMVKFVLMALRWGRYLLSELRLSLQAKRALPTLENVPGKNSFLHSHMNSFTLMCS